ncbi:splicing factor U2AF 26 kDa subunit-like protein [Linnemannia elongata]|nr:splicing factor U2AF 26 kDa subunit-like protein [Linnemannia elongata]
MATYLASIYGTEKDKDFFVELAKYGEIEEMHVCDNIGDHLVGNIYARFKYEEDAGNAVESLNNRFYAGRPLWAELSPVTDFREACCRQYENSECTRGGLCNFMHLKSADRNLKRELFASQRNYQREKRREERNRDHSHHSSVAPEDAEHMNRESSHHA